MKFILHSCGQIEAFIPDFIEIGIDVLQLDQPRLVGHRILRERFGGKICFWNAVDTLWSSQGDLLDEDIEAEAHAMRSAFSDLPGGFMARHYPQPEDIQLSEHFHAVSREAFLRDEGGSNRKNTGIVD
jgi:uroporphyrinogen decarboxylase